MEGVHRASNAMAYFAKKKGSKWAPCLMSANLASRELHINVQITYSRNPVRPHSFHLKFQRKRKELSVININLQSLLLIVYTSFVPPLTNSFLSREAPQDLNVVHKVSKHWEQLWTTTSGLIKLEQPSVADGWSGPLCTYHTGGLA